MLIDILSLFPNYFRGPFDESILKRAQETKRVEIRLVDIRQFASGRHRKVDNRPYGGGPGMVMMPGPVLAAIRHVRREDSFVIYLSPQGKKLQASVCRELAQHKHLILLCGHYEGIDERILSEVDAEISVGDFVLTNGCIGAIALVDSVARLLPGVLGDAESAVFDSFENGLLDYPQYTKPREFEGKEVPCVLRSGNHQEIALWRQEQALKKTARVRPDLLKGVG